MLGVSVLGQLALGQPVPHLDWYDRPKQAESWTARSEDEQAWTERSKQHETWTPL